MRRFLPAAIVLLLISSQSRAVIKVAMPVSKVYEASAAVLQGTVTGLDREKRLLEADVIAVKGVAAERRVRIQVAEPTTLLDEVLPKAPLLIFISQRAAADVVHLADTWLLAERVGQAKTVWRTIQERKDLPKSFPGRTQDLAQIVTRLAFGESPLLDATGHTVFNGGLRDLGKLPVTGATALLSIFANSDSRPDLIISTATEQRLFLATPDGFEEATKAFDFKSLPPGPLGAAVLDERDGLPDLIASTAVVLLSDEGLQKPVALRDAPPQGVIACGAATLTPLQLDPVLITAAGQAYLYPRRNPRELHWEAPAIISLWKEGKPVRSTSFIAGGPSQAHRVMILRDDGPVRYTLEPNPLPSNFHRLTGENLSDRKDYAEGLKNAAGVALRSDSDSKTNYLIISDAGLLLLIDRGFGTYLINPDPAQKLNTRPLGRILAAGDYDHDQADDVFFLSPDGRLHVLMTSSR